MKSICKRFFLVIMVLVMSLSSVLVASASEVSAETTFDLIEYSNNSPVLYASILYSGNGYSSEGNFPSSGYFTVSSSSEVRISYGFVHPSTTGTSSVFLSLNKKNWLGQWEYAGITLELTADQNAHVVSLGTLSSGNYQFVLNAYSNLAFGTITIYSV